VTASRGFQRGLLYVLALLLALVILGPFAWVLSASLQSESAIFKRPPDWIPQPLSLDNYTYVFTGRVPFSTDSSNNNNIGLTAGITGEPLFIPSSLVNSLVIALAVLALNLVLGMLTAYVFARERFGGRTLAFNFILGSRLLPPMAVAIPIYTLLRILGLLDTRLGLVLVHGAFTLPFTIWVLTLYVRALPREVEEAALVDGSGRFGALWHVVVPMAAPGLAAVGAFAFLFSYNEFLFAQLILDSIELKTVPVLLAAISVNPDASYTLIAVGVMLAIIAPILLALVFRRYITSGLVSSLER
jgi:multiple sugar transport system permease protein